MGHARTYVSLDIIRRVVKELLNYNVILCQTVTDIDDKIIIRSSEKGVPFRELAAQYEKEFVEDMLKLGVPMPDLVTRVSEFIPEILTYIQGLMDNGIAYASNGSVYFSTAAFQAAGHIYGKLMPEQVGNSELIAEGEGSLFGNEDKKSGDDFVLWKKTKEHADGMFEPSWSSPWGPGRPGWHIECSAMSNSAFGKRAGGCLDVHAGGVDLKFPHHENEIAQSEGFSGSHQWVNYWLHTGHVNIKGFKMSKSLKNFITIRQALERYSSRQIRFCFVLHKYNEPMDYGDGSMNHAVSIDKIFSEYFHNVKAVLRRLGLDGPQHLGEAEMALLKSMEEAKGGVRASLLDDFDTPKSVTFLLELIRECNRYLEKEDNGISTIIITNVARYITSILRTFGLVPDSIEIGFPDTGSSSSEGGGREQTLTPLLDVLTKFRETVRLAAISGDTKAVLGAADTLRDNILPDLGVRMEDKGSGADVVTIWKLDDPEVLLQERKLKEEAKAEKERQKLETLRKQREKEERSKISPETMFLSQTDLYSSFDSVTGLPTHDKAGELLSKAATKKLQKEQAKQAELYQKASVV
jgi:cysteinyl-tRNA synthetase